jgi:hypothetical protein
MGAQVFSSVVQKQNCVQMIESFRHGRLVDPEKDARTGSSRQFRAPASRARTAPARGGAACGADEAGGSGWPGHRQRFGGLALRLSARRDTSTRMFLENTLGIFM